MGTYQEPNRLLEEGLGVLLGTLKAEKLIFC
jgi:hypothetical protein